MASHASLRRCSIESLESRLLFSLVFDAAGDALLAEAARGGGATVGPAIRLDLVALHEFGHSLGLGHTNDTSSIMYAYYNAGYDVGDFASDSAVQALRTIYSSESTRPWKDALDGDGGVTDGDVDLTYSFVRDGARMDQGGKSNTFATFNRIFDTGTWQAIFTNELQRWAGVSNGTLEVHAFNGDGLENAVYNFNAYGTAQNDSRFGDIRIAAHKFDGPSNVLGHTYYPPPNGSTASGDSHYDASENWVLASSPLLASSSTGPLTGGSSAALRFGEASGRLLFSDVPLHETAGDNADLLLVA